MLQNTAKGKGRVRSVSAEQGCSRFRTGPGKPGKSCNFIVALFFQDGKVLEKGYRSLKIC